MTDDERQTSNDERQMRTAGKRQYYTEEEFQGTAVGLLPSNLPLPPAAASAHDRTKDRQKTKWNMITTRQ